MKSVVHTIVFCALLSSGHSESEICFFAQHGDGPELVSTAPEKAIDFNRDEFNGPGPIFNIAFQDVIDRTRTGFDDPQLGGQRREVAIAVLSYLESIIKNSGGQCDILFSLSENVKSTRLASGGTFYFVGQSSPTFQSGFAFERIVLASPDPTPNEADIRVRVNFAHNFNLNLNAPTIEDRIDLFTVLIHEIGHGLGITTLSGKTGDGSSQFDVAPFHKPVFTTFDDRLFHANGSKIWDANGVFSPNVSLNEGDNSIFWHGEMTGALFTPTPFPPVYSPSEYKSGSSLSHWQNAEPIPDTAVMTPTLKSNRDLRQYSILELSALVDLGYDITLPSLETSWVLF